MTPFEEAENRAHKFALMNAVQVSMRDIVDITEAHKIFFDIYAKSSESIDVNDVHMQQAVEDALNQLAELNDSINEICNRLERHFGISA